MLTQEFYSHGKLLITGEYVILDGANGLAIPTKKGQLLKVTQNNSGNLNWESFDCHNNSWYQTSIATVSFLKAKAPKGNSDFDNTLFKILWHAQQLNSSLFDNEFGFSISTHLEFERLWGLGSSSTLINSIASWANVNPYQLLALSFGGSGYDIAAASATTPIIFSHSSNLNQPNIKEASFDPVFKDQLFFIYLENKKSSKEAIKNYRAFNADNLTNVISEINEITAGILTATSIEEFEILVNLHEYILSKTLTTPTIKEQRFPDYLRSIKSLGGWGGDFVLATGGIKDISYFKENGYSTIIPYSEMVL